MLASHTTAINNSCVPLRCKWLPVNAVSFSIATVIPMSACLRTQPQAGMWANIEVAKAGDPRLPVVTNPCLKTSNHDSTPADDIQWNHTPCPARPPDVRNHLSHSYEKYITETKTRGNVVSRGFGTTLKDVPLFEGTSEGILPVQGHRFPWPHEDLHNPRGINDDESLKHPEKDYFMLPSNTTTNSITKFHKFCKELPDVMCNYCSITLCPEDVKRVALEPEVEGALPAACRASAENVHVPGIEGYTARSSRVKNG